MCLTDREKEFLRLICSDDSYQEIADKMFLGRRTIEKFSESLFSKLNVKSRAGLIMWAIRNKIYIFDS